MRAESVPNLCQVIRKILVASSVLKKMLYIVQIINPRQCRAYPASIDLVQCLADEAGGDSANRLHELQLHADGSMTVMLLQPGSHILVATQ